MLVVLSQNFAGLPATVVNDKVRGLQFVTVNWKSATGAKIFRNLERTHSHSETHRLNCTLRCTLYKVGDNCTEVWKFMMKQSTVVTEFIYLSQSHSTPNPHKLHFDCMLTSNLSESEPTDMTGRRIIRRETQRDMYEGKKEDEKEGEIKRGRKQQK